MSDPNSAHQPSAGVGHETSDFAMRPVVVGAIFLVALSAFAFVAMRFLFVVYETREQRLNPPMSVLAAEQEMKLPPEPRLQARPVVDLQDLRAREESLLTTYGWVDAKQGVVRIPIARAMEVLAKNPPPARGADGGTK